MKQLNQKEVTMSTDVLAKKPSRTPSVFDDFFGPWNEWFTTGRLNDRMLTVPAVNVTEDDKQFQISLAAPGLKKKDFKIAVDGNMLTISSEKEDNNEEKGKDFTRKEYNYTSFSRSFSMPEDINHEKIEATYDEGVLNISLPKRENGKRALSKKIDVK